MKALVVFLLVFNGLSEAFAGGAPISHETLIDRQIAAYNAHDITVFASFFHPDIEQMVYPNQVETLGKAALVDQFSRLFQRHKPNATVISRMVFKNTVIDHERVLYEVDGKRQIAFGVVIYTIQDQRIIRMEVIK